MPRLKTMPDAEVLAVALAIVHESGPGALTFAALARRCGLAAATLVQRFGSKPALVRSTLLHAWDLLDERTAGLAATLPRTPDGAIQLLEALSRGYGDIEAYAEGLLVLREDLRDPVLRARGAAWQVSLSRAIEERFACLASIPAGIGSLMAAQWQGLLLWWSFEPRGGIEAHVRQGLGRFVAALLRSG
ncbi:MAG TPA: TetR/AcrR family transcriptional regulator [Geminicoccaceae bacterium]|nr:TetR/AcrR family transcriptional regulator [Geminicoccus sp.]HMU52484.1 TetR/AcrR family transcriptional regulator [Geminicoccaceae bacterium]